MPVIPAPIQAPEIVLIQEFEANLQGFICQSPDPHDSRGRFLRRVFAPNVEGIPVHGFVPADDARAVPGEHGSLGIFSPHPAGSIRPQHDRDGDALSRPAPHPAAQLTRPQQNIHQLRALEVFGFPRCDCQTGCGAHAFVQFTQHRLGFGAVKRGALQLHRCLIQ